jgi:hypothetical protein
MRVISNGCNPVIGHLQGLVKQAFQLSVLTSQSPWIEGRNRLLLTTVVCIHPDSIWVSMSTK